MSKVSNTKCYTLQLDDKGKIGLINNHSKVLKECNTKEFIDDYNDEITTRTYCEHIFKLNDGNWQVPYSIFCAFTFTFKGYKNKKWFYCKPLINTFDFIDGCCIPQESFITEFEKGNEHIVIPIKGCIIVNKDGTGYTF